jgi:TonB-linked SusC/RagA family outer membrane protein
MRNKNFLLCICLVLVTYANAQSIPIKGTVTDASNQPLPGVNIVEKGTSNGTQTDFDGNYTLNVGNKALLVFSYIGMKTQEVIVGNKTQINLVLMDDAAQLDEVVLIGYGSMRKSDLTGATSKIELESKATIPNTSVMQALQGSIAGLNVGMTTGAGSEPSFSIRGTHSLSAGNRPLIVVDGAIYEGRLTDFAPNDIESVNVLKDASAAAVYGSRAANGVILIATKMGTTEKPQFRLNTYLGINIVSRMPEMNGPEERVQTLIDIAQANGNQNPIIENLFFDPFELENYQKGITTNLDDSFIKTGIVRNYEMSFSGRTKSTNYFVSGNYLDQKGVVSADSYKRYGLRVNLENTISDWLKIGIKSNFATNDFSGVGINYIDFGFTSPFSRLNDDDGKEIRFIQGDRMFSNPLERNRIKDLDMEYSLFGLTYAELNAPFLKGLSYRINFSQNKRWTDKAYFLGFDTYQGTDRRGFGSRTKNERSGYLLDNFLTYENSFGKHSLNMTLLYSREHNQFSNFSGTATQFANDLLGYNFLSSGVTQTIATSASDNNALSQMARFNYNYDNKYILNATVRRDGYSAFGKDQRFGVFPSFGLGYILSNEDFMKQSEVINNLKFRYSYGVNGNQAISSYSTLARVGFSNYVSGQGTAITQFVSSMANSELGWETTASSNFGLDFAILDNRFTGTIDYYTTVSTDLLLVKNISNMTGFNSIVDNIGEMKGNGLEVTLNSVNVKNEDFTWTTDLVYARTRDEITRLYGNDFNKDGIEDDDLPNRWYIGEPASVITGYQPDGVWQLADQTAGLIPTGFKPGDFRIKDLNGDGVLNNDDAQEVFAYRNPNFRISLNNNFNYKRFSLAVLVNSVWGGNGFYQGSNSLNAQNTSSLFWSPERANIPNVPYWTPTNPTNEYPRVNFPNAFNVPYLRDRSFIRLQDVSLAYDLTGYVQGFSSLRAYVSGKNLAIWAKEWYGYDPETGVGIGGVPSMANFVFGLQVAF